MNNPSFPLVVLLVLFVLFAFAGEQDKLEIARKAYAEGYEVGRAEGMKAPHKCSTHEALKWWTEAKNLTEVKRALCSNPKR